mmetsp:Transcript_32123/g.53102  ORF Transcript_32123/g.53102 Transcript_32123/m.53102 type:complete len:94 (+) Transcript_32123:36-317(+)
MLTVSQDNVGGPLRMCDVEAFTASLPRHRLQQTKQVRSFCISHFSDVLPRGQSHQSYMTTNLTSILSLDGESGGIDGSSNAECRAKVDDGSPS